MHPICKKVIIISRGRKNHDSQRCDRISCHFLRLDIGQFSPHFGVIFLLSSTVNLEKKEWNSLEKIEKKSSGDGTPKLQISVPCCGQTRLSNNCPAFSQSISWLKRTASHHVIYKDGQPSRRTSGTNSVVDFPAHKPSNEIQDRKGPPLQNVVHNTPLKAKKNKVRTLLIQAHSSSTRSPPWAKCSTPMGVWSLDFFWGIVGYHAFPPKVPHRTGKNMNKTMAAKLSSLPCFEAFWVIFCPDFCSYFCFVCGGRGSVVHFRFN